MGIEPLSGPQGHSAVKNDLLASQDAALVKIGSDLDTLHGERRRADYDMANVRVESSKTATAVFNQAGRMLAALDACRLAPTRSAQAEAAIKRWATSNQGCALFEAGGFGFSPLTLTGDGEAGRGGSAACDSILAATFSPMIGSSWGFFLVSTAHSIILGHVPFHSHPAEDLP